MAEKQKPVGGTDHGLKKNEDSRDKRAISSKKKRGYDHKRSLVDREATLVFQRVAITVIVTLSLYVIGFIYVWVLLFWEPI